MAFKSLSQNRNIFNTKSYKIKISKHLKITAVYATSHLLPFKQPLHSQPKILNARQIPFRTPVSTPFPLAICNGNQINKLPPICTNVRFHFLFLFSGRFRRVNPPSDCRNKNIQFVTFDLVSIALSMTIYRIKFE